MRKIHWKVPQQLLTDTALRLSADVDRLEVRSVDLRPDLDFDDKTVQTEVGQLGWYDRWSYPDGSEEIEFLAALTAAEHIAVLEATVVLMHKQLFEAEADVHLADTLRRWMRSQPVRK